MFLCFFVGHKTFCISQYHCGQLRCCFWVYHNASLERWREAANSAWLPKARWAKDKKVIKIDRLKIVWNKQPCAGCSNSGWGRSFTIEVNFSRLSWWIAWLGTSSEMPPFGLDISQNNQLSSNDPRVSGQCSNVHSVILWSSLWEVSSIQGEALERTCTTIHKPGQCLQTPQKWRRSSASFICFSQKRQLPGIHPAVAYHTHSFLCLLTNIRHRSCWVCVSSSKDCHQTLSYPRDYRVGIRRILLMCLHWWSTTSATRSYRKTHFWFCQARKKLRFEDFGKALQIIQAFWQTLMIKERMIS